LHCAGAAQRHAAAEFCAVIPSTSRKTQRSGVSPSTSTLCVLPLTLMEKAMMNSHFRGSLGFAAKLLQR
jgi:hypothetical protein